VRQKTWMWLAAAALVVLPAARAAAQETTPPPTAPTEPAAEEAPEKSWSVDLALDYADQYLFRGVVLLGEDEEVLVPHATLTIGNFSLWTYGYIGEFGEDPDEGDYNEVDVGADYTFSAGKFSLTLGALTYQYTGEVERGLGFADTEELYAIAAWDVMLSPTVSYYHDIDAIDGGYLQAGISHSFPLGDKVSLDLSGAVGFDNKYNSDQAFQLNDILLGLDVPWQVTDSFSLHAMVQQSFALDALDDIDQGDETVFTIGAGYSF
jgi:hypothetical protein